MREPRSVGRCWSVRDNMIKRREETPFRREDIEPCKTFQSEAVERHFISIVRWSGRQHFTVLISRRDVVPRRHPQFCLSSQLFTVPSKMKAPYWLFHYSSFTVRIKIPIWTFAAPKIVFFPSPYRSTNWWLIYRSATLPTSVTKPLINNSPYLSLRIRRLINVIRQASVLFEIRTMHLIYYSGKVCQMFFQVLSSKTQVSNYCRSSNHITYAQ
jgi:hypothetical protein